jgi:hypothetical protein
MFDYLIVQPLVCHNGSIQPWVLNKNNWMSSEHGWIASIVTCMKHTLYEAFAFVCKFLWDIFVCHHFLTSQWLKHGPILVVDSYFCTLYIAHFLYNVHYIWTGRIICAARLVAWGVLVSRLNYSYPWANDENTIRCWLPNDFIWPYTLHTYWKMWIVFSQLKSFVRLHHYYEAPHLSFSQLWASFCMNGANFCIAHGVAFL